MTKHADEKCHGLGVAHFASQRPFLGSAAEAP
jgi:hypothetical protein